MRRVVWAIGAVVALPLLLAGPRAVHGQEESPPYRHTLKELRDRNIVKQETDYSCAAAALATLLTYYFGDRTLEPEIILRMEDQLSEEDRETRRQRGYSLLDLKRVAEAKGYAADGFKLTLEQLEQLAAPVIVFVSPLEYKHFAVLRKVERGHVFLADPARGNLRMSVGRFSREWSGIVFVVGKPAAEAKLAAHPLTVTELEHVQPALLRLNRLLDETRPASAPLARPRLR